MYVKKALTLKKGNKMFPCFEKRRARNGSVPRFCLHMYEYTLYCKRCKGV